jgi:spore coat protein U-like protein
MRTASRACAASLWLDRPPSHSLARSVKRTLALAVLIASAPASRAQTSTAPISVTAKVQSAVTLSGMVPLDFGTGIVPGTPATVTPANGGKIMASYNVNTQLSLPNTVTLTRAGGGSVLVSLSCAQSSSGTAPAPTPFATDCATGYGAALVGNARTDWWLYLGGAITGAATASVPAGNYSGNATVTATYTTF